MQLTKNFILQEFIYPEIYQQWGDRAIWFIDYRIVNIMQYLRTKIGKSITVNNWHVSGSYKESGLRAFDTPTGGKLSQHKFGRAVDLKVEGLFPFEVLEFIQKRYRDFSALGLTAVEDTAYTPMWLHLDCRNWNDTILHIVKP